MKWTIDTARAAVLLLAGVGLTLGLPVETKAGPSSSACSSRYQTAWEMPLRDSDIGRKLEDVLQRSEFGLARINSIRRTSIARGPGGRVALQMNIPKGENRSSTFFLAPLGKPGPDAACLSLQVYLENGFEWPRSGAGTKMGWGLWGGEDVSTLSGGTRPSQQGGWSVRNVNTDWGFRLYSYHLNRSGQFGQQGTPVARFNSSDWGTGRWHKIEVEIVLNDPGKNNGYAQIWLDGENRQTMTGLRFRNSRDWGIRGLMFNDMWGGTTSNPKQFSPKRQKMWYANYTLYTGKKTSATNNTSSPSSDDTPTSISTPASEPSTDEESTANASTTDISDLNSFFGNRSGGRFESLFGSGETSPTQSSSTTQSSSFGNFSDRFSSFASRRETGSESPSRNTLFGSWRE